MADSHTSKPAAGRARARGRARGPQLAAKPRRPEEITQQQTQQPAPRPVASSSSAPTECRGRAAQRGAASTAALAQQMSAMSVGAGSGGGEDGNAKASAGRGANRGRAEKYEDPVVIPSAGDSKRGSHGTVVKLAANYFSVDKLPQTSHYQYHVEFNPTIESIRMRKGMLYGRKDLFPRGYQFDGMALWASTKLQQVMTEVIVKRKTDDENIRIQIKFIKEVSPRDPVMLQILSIQQRKNFTYLDFKEIDRQYYDIAQTTRLDQQRMEFIPGFTTAIRQHETNVLMNVELKFKFMRQETVLQLFKEQHKKNPRDFRANSEKLLLGAIVMTTYNNKTYRIDEIKWDMTVKDKFDQKRGNQITYIDYMKQHYNLSVEDPGQPLLMSKPKVKDLKRGDVTIRYLVPEFCVMTGLDDEKRADFNAMRELANHTRVPPDGRVAKLTHFMKRINTDPRVIEDMKNWCFKFSDNLVSINGRNLGCENIIMTADPSSNGFGYNIKEADWSREIRGARLLEPVGLQHWVLIHTGRDQAIANDFVSTFERVCRPMGMLFPRPTIGICQDDRTGTFSQVLKNTVSPSTQLVVVIVPNNKKDRYDAIKKFCVVDMGIPSQVIVTRSLSKKQTIMSVATKIAIQVNCKLGGQVWRVKNPFDNCMVVGIDSYHDSAQRNRSVCATVCSMNQFLTKYYSQVSFQTAKQEMSDAFVAQVTAALKNYKNLNKKLPSPIFFYRDGVGDGQLPQVREWEINQINRAIEALGDPTYQPKLSFIVVNKRINTRFFQSGTRGWENPLSGTVIDTVVTRPERYDFFLVSQSVRQGTVGPTQYNVIYDRSNLIPDRMQRFTYKLTHLYYNWQGTIRVPAPCQYAHKLAFLVGQSLHSTPNPRLADTLFYL
uniref:Uncharacterized protein n=1 Tax=Strigamia maritima TaxID=126957 RepID=T1IRX1_STRMM